MNAALQFSRANPIRLGIVGVGKIAMDRHLPALANIPQYRIVATASRAGSIDGVASFPDVGSMLSARSDLDAVSLCLPPAGRAEVARAALAAGLHVMLEKPPGVTVTEVEDLADRAAATGATLFTAWHSREASGVAAARDWLAPRRIAAVRVNWLEDARVWHPGQRWIWEEGGFGAFDPGINALSILTHILPGRIVLRRACLEFPVNCHTPMCAQLVLGLDGGDQVAARFDFKHQGPPRWDIEIDTDGGPLLLSNGGEQLSIGGRRVAVPEGDEYERLYARFAALIGARRSEVDLSPLQLVADALLCGKRVPVEAIEE